MNKWLMAALVVAACLFGVYLLTTMPPKEQDAAPSDTFAVPDVPLDADAAMQLYKANCLSCHGAELQGKFGPALAKVGSTLSKEQIYKRIEQGGGGMPKFAGKLTDDQLANLANWLAGHQ